MNQLWQRYKRVLPKVIGAIVLPIIFYRLLRPMWERREAILPVLSQIRWELVALAALMFAVNQYFCRVVSWRGVLKGMGHPLPRAASARVWAHGELARYIPGMVWQVLGRAVLARPYGLSMTACTISQILEMTLYLVASLVVALSTLSLVSGQVSAEVQKLFRAAAILLPFLLAFLHPRIFYPITNAMLRKLGKPAIAQRVSGWRLLELLVLGLAGQFWLGLAIWIATWPILHVPLASAWILPGAYSLAWAVGFCLGAIAPSGIGFRELVLGGTLFLVLPPTTNLDQKASMALFGAIALLLRMWAMAGELLFAGFVQVWDWKRLGQIQGQTQPSSVAPANEVDCKR